MVKTVLFDYIDKAGIETGNLKAYYDLSGSVDVLDAPDTYKDSFYKLTSGATKALDTYVVYNQLLPTGSQLVEDSEDNPLISAEGYPAIISSTSTSITGSGLLDGSCSLRVSAPQIGDSWTCFFDFSGYDIDSDTYGLNQVLLSTMNSNNSLSGFNFGINGSNRLYYEYISGGENNYYDEGGTEKRLNISPSFQRETQSLTTHLRNLNIVSLSKNKNGVEFSLHKPNENTDSLKTLTPEFSGSSDLILGGMSPEFEAGGEIYNNFYTGFSGYVNTFLLFNDYIPETSRNTIAESFWLDSYTPESLVTGESTHKEVTGVEVQNVLSGQGIVSYSLEQTGHYTNQNGDDVPIYREAPVMGNVYQDVLVDLTGPNDIKSITGKYVDEQAANNGSYVNNIEGVAGKIKFADPLEAGEIYEIYSHDKYTNAIANKAELLGGKLNLLSFGTYEPANLFVENPDQPAAGEKFFAKIKSNNFTYSPTLQPYFQLFRNGLYQQEVSGVRGVDKIFYLYNVLRDDDLTNVYDGQYFINDPDAGYEETDIDDFEILRKRIKNNQYYIALNNKEATWDAKNDNLIFDLASGAAITGEYDGEQKEFGGDYHGKDIYYNGQKLISGIHFLPGTDSNGDPAIYANPDKISAAQHSESLPGGIPVGSKLVFVPPASNYYVRATGIINEGSTLKEIPVDNIFFEQVWRNGRRMIPGVDYFKVPDNSLIDGGDSPSQINKSFVMDANPNSIDVKVLSEAENKKTKVFSLNKNEQKQNLFEKV
jgi:hypothetical protein